MKRLALIVFVLASTLDTFAYYSDYGYSSSKFEMPGWFTFMGIVMIIWGILEIILFFKIWGMTDNIKALKKDHFNETVFETKAGMARYLRTNLVLGNIENVKKTLLKNFIDNVERGYGELQTGGYIKDEKGNDVWVRFEEKNLDEPITPYVDNLILQYGKIGEEVPVYILRMKTFRDYYKLFVKEDLTVEVEKKEVIDSRG